MKQTQFEQEWLLNRNTYDRLRDEIRRNYAGRYVAIAQGRIVTVADSFDAASAAVLQLQPPPEHFVVFEGDKEPMFEIVDDLHWHVSMQGP